VRLKPSSFSSANLLIVLAVLSLTPAAWAKPQFKVLASIPGGLYGGLTLGPNGNLYGTTSGGGDYGYGSIFEMTRNAKGEWSVITLHSFDGSDGSSPDADLVFGATGSLYGTAPDGGTYDHGTIFALDPSFGGWNFSVLYNFCRQYHCPDGGGPFGGLIVNKAGVLYGTTVSGGAYGGVVYGLSHDSDGWNERVLYNFGSGSHDGSDPLDTLTVNKSGDLYGTTFYGGAYGYGTVFRVTHASGDSWKERLLYSFCPGGFPCIDGMHPYAGVIFDNSGNLYGTTTQGGHNSCGETHCGTVFKLTRSQGRWKETVLYEFPNPETGSVPTGGVVRDKAGNLYGATVAGGVGNCPGGCGVAYKLASRPHGNWKYTVLHKFTGGDGWQPLGGLIFDSEGDLYGTAYSRAFEIMP